MATVKLRLERGEERGGITGGSLACPYRLHVAYILNKEANMAKSEGKQARWKRKHLPKEAEDWEKVRSHCKHVGHEEEE